MNLIHLNRLVLNKASLNALGSFEGKAGGVNWETVTVSGVGRVELDDPKANGIVSVLLNGGCTQASSPSPTSPKDIRTNRGSLGIKFGKNLLEVKDENIVVGKYINNNGVPTDSLPNCYFQRFVAVKANTPYTLSTSKHINYANFMEYDSDGVFLKRTLYGSTSAYVGTSVTHTMGDTTAFVIIGSNIDSAAFPTLTKENVKSRNWMFNEGSEALKYEAFSMSIVDSSSEKIMVNSTNATVFVERLLGLAGYNDTQEVVSGAVVRRCGFAILDGSENISRSNSVYTIGISGKIKTKTSLLCTHFGYSSSTSSAVADNKIISFASQNVGFRYDACADAEAFRQWLQMQYAKQKPVIVVYPLATQVAENVTPNALPNEGRDDRIDRVDNTDDFLIEMPIDVVYKKEIKTSSRLITFTIGSVEYQAEEGMTWRDWCVSEYNTDWFYVTEDNSFGVGSGSGYNFTSEFITDGSGGGWTNVGIFKQDKDLVDNYSESPEDVIIANYPYLHHS